MSDKMGIINVLKPPGMSSFHVVNWIKKNMDIAKVGHTGTLDPRATGVLPVCIGRATKVISHLPEGSKEYIAELRLGKVTDTLDAEGEVVHSSDKWQLLKKSEISRVVNNYIGDLAQIPPMFSAIKYNGKRLYKIARKGEEIEREPRHIKINDIKILSIKLPKVRIKVRCSKGTYIRSLARDIGEELNCGAYLSFLIRTASGPFQIINSYTLRQLSYFDDEQDYSFIIPPDNPLVYKSLNIKNSAYKKAINGTYLNKFDFVTWPDLKDGEKVLVYSNDGQFISVSEIDDFDCKPIRVFA
jgi:tRNA pseudouridine55 synthase